MIDPVPTDVDKKAFNLRRWSKDKQLAHSTFRTKSVTEVDRLNTQYCDDLRVLDCEVLNANPKKRISMPQANKIYHKKMAA